MLHPFHLREQIKDLHPIAYAWRFLQPLLFGQLRTEPPRVCRRRFGLSHAAMAGCSSMA